MKNAFTLLLLLLFTVICNAQFILKDKFGRDLSGHGITLVDWEGYLANPAIQLVLEPATGTSTPVVATLSADHARLYFNTPSSAGPNGPTKTLSFSNGNPIDFYLSVFPDREDGDEQYTLTVTSSQGSQMFTINVIDQDVFEPEIEYNLIVDFSRDQPIYNFFGVQAHRDIVMQAASDWAYFLADMDFDQVPANAQVTWIWNDDFNGGMFVPNQAAYTGFLLYAYGIHTTPHRSGGEGSTNGFQSINGVATKLRRAGGYEAEVHGNFNTLGWNTAISDDTWYVATNFGNVQNDLYSIALHEIGHAINFNPAYPDFQNFKNQGFIDDPEVVAYQGENVPIDPSDHLSNGQVNDQLKFVDRVSKKGTFGSEYANFVPYSRWLITKLNLLCLQAIGYELRETSAFKSVGYLTGSLPDGALANAYVEQVEVEGGIPFYHFEIMAGSLPPGLVLDAFTGQVSGTPTEIGNFSFTLQVTDYDDEQEVKAFNITIGESVGLEDPDDVLDQISLYPNPAHSMILLEIGGDIPLGNNSALKIYNLLGQLIARENISNRQQLIPVDHLNNSLYLFEIEISQTLKKVIKVVIE